MTEAQLGQTRFSTRQDTGELSKHEIFHIVSAPQLFTRPARRLQVESLALLLPFNRYLGLQGQ